MAGGLIDATNGTLFLNPGDAFSNGGFSNAASATVRVENSATLALNRTASAWNNSGLNPRNLGTISLQGGSVATYADGRRTPRGSSIMSAGQSADLARSRQA